MTTSGRRTPTSTWRGWTNSGVAGARRWSEALYTAAGHLAGRGSALGQTGWYHAQLGEYEAAIADCERALSLQLAAGHRYGQAGTWDSLGFAQHRLSRYREAAECYRRAIELHRDTGDRYREASTLARSADCHDAAGHAEIARREWTVALAILESLDHADADGVRLKLRRFDTPTGTPGSI
jgi:tetratricopeptide (TPR) repeat protein